MTDGPATDSPADDGPATDGPATDSPATDRAVDHSPLPGTGLAARVPDRMLLLALVLAVAVLAATVTVGMLVYRNPTTPPLAMPTATSL